MGFNGKLETPKQHWFFELYYSLNPNDRSIAGLIKHYKHEKKVDETTRKKNNEPPEMIYKLPSMKTLYNWLNNFSWKERVIDRLYDEVETITDEATEYTLHMYKRNKKIHMDMSKAHEALVLINNYYVNLVTRQSIGSEKDASPEEKKETIELQTKISYQLQSFTQLQFNSTETINNSIATLQEWKEIKDRLKPHHNEFTSTEESLQANIDTIDYFYDNYVNTD